MKCHQGSSIYRGKVIPLIDYASTGRTYGKPKDPHAIKEILANRVSSTQRVWHLMEVQE